MAEILRSGTDQLETMRAFHVRLTAAGLDAVAVILAQRRRPRKLAG
jgi:hypothetical protein